MAIVCPACGTENRSVAKFCIECIAPLPNEFAATQAMTPSGRAEEDLPSVLAAFASSGPPTAPSARMTLPTDWVPSTAPAPRRQGVGIGLAIAVLLVAGTVGWVAAVGWPGGKDADAQQAEPVRQRQAAGRVAEPPAPEEHVEPDPTPVEALAPGETIVPVDPAPAASPQLAQEPPALSAPERAAPAVAKASAAPAKAERAHAFFASCDGLSFIAASRCKVDLCGQKANRQRADCQPVLAQQRAMEEKRNPTLAN